jgi:polar amino acid transport system substrate-binding protein
MTTGVPRRRLVKAAAQGAILLGAMRATPAFAEGAGCPAPALAEVKKRGKLIAGVKTDYAPFGYIDESGKLTGFDIAIVNYIADKLGVGVDLRPVTSANRIPMLQSGVADLLAASLTMTRERMKAIDFCTPYIVIGSRFLVQKGSGIMGYADLAGKTVAFTQGTPWDVKLRQNQPAAIPLVLQDKPQAVQAVLQGKAAAYIDDAAPLIMFAKHQPDKLEAVGEPARPSPMGIGLRQNDAEWRNTIEFALSDMYKDGTYAKAYKEAFGSEPDPHFQIYSWEL